MFINEHVENIRWVMSCHICICIMYVADVFGCVYFIFGDWYRVNSKHI